MRALMPMPEISSFRREMDRLFDRFWEGDGENLPARGWMPSLDFSETPDAYLARIEIPGLEPKDVEVTFQDNVLFVKGEKKEEFKHKDERVYRVERGYGMFTRTLRMPLPVDGGKVTAIFKNGLLTVTMPKAPEAKASTIQVKVA